MCLFVCAVLACSCGFLVLGDGDSCCNCGSMGGEGRVWVASNCEGFAGVVYGLWLAVVCDGEGEDTRGKRLESILAFNLPACPPRPAPSHVPPSSQFMPK